MQRQREQEAAAAAAAAAAAGDAANKGTDGTDQGDALARSDSELEDEAFEDIDDAESSVGQLIEGDANMRDALDELTPKQRETLQQAVSGVVRKAGKTLAKKAKRKHAQKKDNDPKR